MSTVSITAFTSLLVSTGTTNSPQTPHMLRDRWIKSVTWEVGGKLGIYLFSLAMCSGFYKGATSSCRVCKEGIYAPNRSIGPGENDKEKIKGTYSSPCWDTGSQLRNDHMLVSFCCLNDDHVCQCPLKRCGQCKEKDVEAVSYEGWSCNITLDSPK